MKPSLPEDAALKHARDYLTECHSEAADRRLAAQRFDRGWLVGFAKTPDFRPEELATGALVLIVDDDGSVEESSTSFPPSVIVRRYLAKHL